MNKDEEKIKQIRDSVKKVDIALLVIHFSMMIFFFCIGAPFMGAINIGSIIIYIGLYYPILKDKYYVYLYGIYTEILAYMVIAVIVLGTECNFQIYALSMIPSYFFAYYCAKKITEVDSYNPYAYAVFSTLIYLISMIFSKGSKPLYADVIAPYAFYIGIVNILICCIFITVYMYLLINVSFAREGELERDALKDPLTNLYNRRALERIIESFHGTYGLLILDLDDFKIFNDIHGHDCGDYVLRKTAMFLQERKLESHKIARFGGDEFLVFIENPTNSDDKYVRASLLDFTKQSFSYDNVPLSVHGCAGYAISKPGEAFVDVLRRADEQLYQEKAKKNVQD